MARGLPQARAPGAQVRHGAVPRRRRQADLYGAGYVTGSIIGIPKTSKHKDQAWLLVKYLGTNPTGPGGALERDPERAHDLASLKSPALQPLPGFQTFLDVFGNANTTTTPITRIGAANQETFQSFISKYLSGSKTDLEGGLAEHGQADRRAAQAGRGGTGAVT